MASHVARGPRQVTVRKLLASVVVLLTLAGFAMHTWSDFSSTTSNTGNNVAAGTVTLTDDDAGTAMFDVSGMKPGDTSESCIRVSYSGSLPATVKLFGSVAGTGLANHLQLVVRKGTIGAGVFGSCTGFVPDATDYFRNGPGVVFTDALSVFPTDWNTGIDDHDVWRMGETYAYQFELTLANDPAAQGLTALPAFTWEARNAGYDAIVTDDAPSSWWKLDETVGVTAADVPGGIVGTYSGGPTLGRPAGANNGGYAVYFDGSNDKLTVGDVYDFAGLVPMTVEAWVNRTTLGEATFRRVVSKDWSTDSSNRGGWALKLESTTNTFGFTRYNNVPTATIVSTTVSQPDTWYHVAVTFDGSNLRMYVNGALEATVANGVSLPDHAHPLTIAHQADGGSKFQGDIDEVAIWGRALSGAEISAHYDAGR